MENDALRARYERIDSDGDGRIDEREFSVLLESLSLGYTSEQVTAAFNSIDLDGNGRIEFGEFAAWWTSGR